MDWVGYAYEYANNLLGEDMHASQLQSLENIYISKGKDDEVRSLKFCQKFVIIKIKI